MSGLGKMLKTGMRLLSVGLLLGGLLGAVPAQAQPRPLGGPGLPAPGTLAPGMRTLPHRGPVDIRMMVIQASNTVEGYAPEIQHLQRHLAFLNYKGFRLMFRNDMQLMPAATRSLGLFDGKVIEVTLNSATQEKAVLRVRMYNPQQPSGVALDTTVSVVRKGTFFIGGPRYEDGVLLLPITAWY